MNSCSAVVRARGAGERPQLLLGRLGDSRPERQVSERHGGGEMRRGTQYGVREDSAGSLTGMYNSVQQYGGRIWYIQKSTQAR